MKLSRAQRFWLGELARRDRIRFGRRGQMATVTARILEERGMIRLEVWGWRAGTAQITDAGRRALAEANTGGDDA